MLTLALIVGAITGLGAVAFRWLIGAFQGFFFNTLGDGLFSGLGAWSVLPLPILGGLIVGLLVYFFASEAKGHGVPEVMAAIALRGGRIRPVVVLVKSLASAITIGSGGSAGREGPIVQIGSGLGSTIGQFLNLSDRRTRSLVASGAAAGIAATFNTPIGGVIFAMEVILLGAFAAEIFSTVVVSAVVATVVSHALVGEEIAFLVPKYTLVSHWELLLYVGLGVFSAVTGTLFIKLLHTSEVLFEQIKIPDYLKAGLGGVAVGLIGVYVPQVFGVGYQSIDLALVGQLGAASLALFVVAKLIATSFTLGSGGSGGVFAPSLFMGAMIGGLYGQWVGAVWPELAGTSGAYALVGMAGVFASTGRAPISAVMILFEMTQNYAMILPLLFTAAVSATLSQFMSRESIYTVKLKARGIDLMRRKDLGVLEGVRVGDAMKPVDKLTTINPDLSLNEMARVFRQSFHHGFAVEESSGHFFGIITLKDLERVMRVGQLNGLTVRDVAVTKVVTAYPDETLDDVLRIFGALDVGRIPVVSREDKRKLVGMLRWSDIVRAHSSMMMDLEYESGTVLVRCDIEAGDPVVGKSLREIALPPEFVINSIQRGRHIVVPRGETVIQAGDCLHVLTDEDKEEAAARYFYQPREAGRTGKPAPIEAP
ncbi:chloride channel protein [Myxococcota bacterium]|nr:chloride channel protein [Myxococcota bacterium]